MQTVEGIYQNGHIKLLETPKEIRRARVIVTFLNDEKEKESEPQQSLVGTIEILSGLGGIPDDDLEAASLEIRQDFLNAIEKSGEEVNR